MFRFVIIFALALAPGNFIAAEAGIGDTEAELVARFGAAQARMPERIQAQGRIHVLGERIVLKQAEWRVTAVLINGRCAKITYVKKGRWAELQFRELLSRNADRWAWNEIRGGAPKWQRTWRRVDGLVAKWMYAGGFAIEAQPFVDARRRVWAVAQQERTTASAQ
jgi:hypothetical protein